MKECPVIIPIHSQAIRPLNCPYGATPLTLRYILFFGGMRMARLMLSIGALIWALLLINELFSELRERNTKIEELMEKLRRLEVRVSLDEREWNRSKDDGK